jgi:hypothetical protein
MSHLVTGDAVVLGLQPAKLPSRALAVALDLTVLVVGYLVIGVLLLTTVLPLGAAVAETVSPRAHQPTLGLLNVSHQAGQVVGFLSGGTIAVVFSAQQALGMNAAAAIVAGTVLAATPLRPLGGRRERAGQPPARISEGVRVLWSHPVLRFVAIAAWATMIASAVPESLATTTSAGTLVAVGLASNAAGGVVGMLAAGRLPRLVEPRVQIWWVLASGLGFGATALAIALHAPALVIAAGNALVGVSSGWLVGAQAAVVRHAPPERIAQVTATMIAARIVLAGLGAVVVATLAVVAGAAAAYLTVSVLLVGTTVALVPLVRRTSRLGVLPD